VLLSSGRGIPASISLRFNFDWAFAHMATLQIIVYIGVVSRSQFMDANFVLD
jgi:hypothetical protein